MGPLNGSPRVILNVLASTVEAAVAASHAHGDSVVIGVPVRNFGSNDRAVRFVEALQGEGVRVSVGLGDGEPGEWNRALTVALATRPYHLNQVFPAAGLSQRALADAGATTAVNALIRPSGVADHVVISTGPLSEMGPAAVVPIRSAAAMAAEVGVRSFKLFPISSDPGHVSLKAVAQVAAERGMMLEPTGGITLDNLEPIVTTCLRLGVPAVMPHLYSSLLNRETGDLDLERLATAMEIVRGVMAVP